MTVTAEQRQKIRASAGSCCEYCRVPQNDLFSKFQIDHIIPLKHGGKDTFENLCFACLKCNSYKGSNVAALDPETMNATKLYNARTQIWDEHFQINSDATLTGKSPEGRATIFVLRINESPRVIMRYMAMELGDYPCKQE